MSELQDFATSKAFTLGVELELQIVGRHDYDLAPGAADLLRLTSRRQLAADVKPEITSSMIELSTGPRSASRGQPRDQDRAIR